MRAKVLHFMFYGGKRFVGNSLEVPPTQKSPKWFSTNFFELLSAFDRHVLSSVPGCSPGCVWFCGSSWNK